MYARRAARFKPLTAPPPGELPPLDPREVRRFIDTDASGAGNGLDWDNAYPSLNAWNAAESTNLVTPDNFHRVYCRASAGTADTTSVNIASWTTSPTNYVLIQAAPGHEALKTGWDIGRYRLSVSGGSVLSISDVENIIVKGLQIERTDNGYNYTIRVDAYGSATGVEFDSCYLRTTLNRLLSMAGGNPGIARVNSSILATGRRGIDIAAAASLIMYQSSYRGSNQQTGFTGGGSLTATNSAIFNFTTDIGVTGTVLVDHCATDDGDGTNPVSPSLGDWNNEFSDPANGNFTLLNSGNLYLGGTIISGGPPVDIEGDPWHPTTPSIGADEF